MLRAKLSKIEFHCRRICRRYLLLYGVVAWMAYQPQLTGAHWGWAGRLSRTRKPGTLIVPLTSTAREGVPKRVDDGVTHSGSPINRKWDGLSPQAGLRNSGKT